MNKEALLAALNLAKGSLLSMDYVPILTHFCFGSESLYAYNDKTAVVVEFESGMDAVAIRGDVLLGILPTMKAEVEFEYDEKTSSVTIKSGRSRASIPARPSSEFLFTVPDEKPRWSFAITEDLVRGLELVLPTVGDNAMQREYTGVTMLVTGSALSFNTTNQSVFSRYTTEARSIGKGKVEEGEVLFQREFCDQVVSLFKTQDAASKAQLSVTKGWAVAEFPHVTLYGKLMKETPPRYNDALKQLVPTAGKKWYPVPTGLKAALDRAVALWGADPDKTVQLEIEGDRLHVRMNNAGRSMDDSLKLKAQAEPMTVNVLADSLSRVLDNAKQMSINKSCVALASGDYLCAVGLVKE